MRRDVLTGLKVALGSPESKFSGAVDPATRKITVAGTVRDNKPFLTGLGAFEVDLGLEVRALFPRSNGARICWDSSRGPAKAFCCCGCTAEALPV